MPISFTFPWALAGVLAGALLWLAYRKRKTSSRRIVASLFILKQLARHKVVGKKFKPPLRFFLELTAILALALAASMPLWSNKKSQILILVDNSLSMQAKTSDKSRLDVAKQAIRDFVKINANNSFSIFSTSPTPKQIALSVSSSFDIDGALDKIQPAASSENIEFSLKHALTELANKPPAKVAIATDRKLNFADIPKKNQPEIIHLDSFRPAENSFFTSAQLSTDSSMSTNTSADPPNRGPSTGLSQDSISASIYYSGEFPVSLPIQLYSVVGTNQRQLQEKIVSLQPNTEYTVSFDPLESAASGSIFKLRLATDKVADAISLDNQAWLAISSSRGEKLLLVTQDGQQNLGLNDLPTFSVDLKSLNTYNTELAPNLDRYTAVVFHQVTPGLLPKTPTLLITPPNSALLPIINQEQKPQITSWSEESPITRYLKLPLLKPSAAAIFNPPVWMKSVVNSGQGPVLVTGEIQGRKIAATGFELLPFEGKKTPIESILLLNLLSWLSGGINASPTAGVGTSYNLEPNKAAIVQLPSGELKQFDTSRGQSGGAALELTQPGAYTINYVDDSTRNAAEAKKLVVTANSFSFEESAVYGRREVLLDSSAENAELKASAKLSSQDSLWWFLSALGLGFLLIETLLASRSEQYPASGELHV